MNPKILTHFKNLTKERNSRGFSLGEFKEAKIPTSQANSLGVILDTKRDTVYEKNVALLKDILKKNKEAKEQRKTEAKKPKEAKEQAKPEKTEKKKEAKKTAAKKETKVEKKKEVKTTKPKEAKEQAKPTKKKAAPKKTKKE